MKKSTPRYEKILFDDLGIPADYFDDEAHQKVIRNSLLGAADAMIGRLGDVVGINACVHVASSIVLMGSDPQKLAAALKEIEDDFPEIDPTIVVTAASLYYLLRDQIARKGLGQAKKKKLRYVRQRFQDMQWMIGPDRMRQLSIK